MKIDKLILKNFRSYENLNMKFSSSLNIFTGYNAQGKTNIIEAIYYAALGTSYRLKNDNDLINWDKENAIINIDFSRLDIDNNIKFYLYKKKRRQIILNGQAIRQRDLPGNITVVLFSPEDLLLIKGAPSLRRRFLDIELSQTDIFYYNTLVKYNKIVNQRNMLLKKIREHRVSSSTLSIWDAQLVEAAVFIWQRRYKAIELMSDFAAEMQKAISSEKEILRMKYKIKNIVLDKDILKSLKNVYQEALIKSRDDDIRRGSTNIGPHHDDIELFINHINLKNFGSQGQQRTSVLSLKLAELSYIKSISGQYPILLLDDVMSELDEKRRERMLEYLQKKEIQIFITTTDDPVFQKIKDARFYKVSLGNVQVK